VIRPAAEALPTSTAPMWWDGGDRAITAREKATIEEHGPSCYTVPLVPAQAVDPEDPWRGLYLPARMPAPSEYGDLFHPDIPRWPDDREDALDKLVHAQGFDFHIVAGDFTEAALEDADELYWQEMRTWNPEAPEGEWRLAWKGDTEDGPYAWFVRPMALRSEPDALAARQPGVQVPVADWSKRGGKPTDWRNELLTLAEHHDPIPAFARSAMRVIARSMPAPPAQGIDLGQFNALAALANAVVHHGDESPMKNGVFGEAERLLALIGQRDAAPGVGNG